MPKVERDIVTPANATGPAGNRVQNGFLRLDKAPSQVYPSNEGGARGDRRGGSGSLAEIASPVTGPDHRFKLDDAKMPQPQSAFAPGQGAVPINPPAPGSKSANRVCSEAAMAKPRSRF
jgi:hypothetical protein